MIVPANQKALQYIPRSILQSPFELLLAFMCVTSGTTYVLGNVPASAIDRYLPSYLVRGWGMCLAFGGTLLIYGILKGSPLVQRAGLSLLAPTSFVYSIMLIVFVGLPSIFSASIITAFAIACLLKDYMIKIATVSIRRVFAEEQNEG